LAQISVLNSGWAPYKYVSFEALPSNSEVRIPEMSYFFYDSDDFEEKEVIEELNFGFEYNLNYRPDELKRKFFHKKGKIKLYNKKIKRIIHISDIEKVEKIDLEDEFICQGMQFQYLIVSNGKITVKVIYTHFNAVENDLQIEGI
jgi:hypothetical protein